MSEIVERVARAIQATRGPKENWDRVAEETRQLWIADARAAITAMREPTDAMMLHGANYPDCSPIVRDGRVTMTRAPFLYGGWRAMIDAALK